MRFRIATCVLGLVGMASSTLAADQPTVDSLLKDGYQIVGTVPSNAGPGLFLKKGTALYLCFVAETPSSATVATQYCKPVK